MTTERTVVVTAPLNEGLQILVGDIRAAAARARKAEPGDREDACRFETLSSQLESWAVRQIGEEGVSLQEHPAAPRVTEDDDAAMPRIQGDWITVSVCLPLELGKTNELHAAGTITPPRQAWRSPDNARGKRATTQRFEAQCAEASRV